jgi:hypothetical protein
MRAEDHEYWEGVHNTHLGERAFILASGPSLESMRLDGLKGEFVLGVSQLAQWQGLPVSPNAWACSEHDDLPKIVEQTARLKIPKWFSNPLWHSYDRIHPGWQPDDTWRWIYSDSFCTWSGFPEKWDGQLDLLGLGDEFWRVGCGHTPVIQPGIPALVWMGFREIYLLGVDHTKQDHVYGQDGSRRQDVGRANRAFENIVPALAEHGVKVRNCSPGSLAPVPYESLESVL